MTTIKLDRGSGGRLLIERTSNAGTTGEIIDAWTADEIEITSAARSQFFRIFATPAPRYYPKIDDLEVRRQIDDGREAMRRAR